MMTRTAVPAPGRYLFFSYGYVIMRSAYSMRAKAASPRISSAAEYIFQPKKSAVYAVIKTGGRKTRYRKT